MGKENTHRSNVSSVLAAALSLAAKGFHVLPIWWVQADSNCACPRGATCGDTGKHPITARGLNDATTNSDTIGAWWQRYPSANIAVALEASGLIAFDIDNYNGDDQRLVDLQRELAPLPDTVAQRSGSGKGFHRLYRAPGNPIRGKLHGITMRARNYVVVAPSNHKSGLNYEWLPGHAPGEIEFAELPPEISKALAHTSSPDDGGVPEEEPGWLNAIPDDVRLIRMREYLNGETGEVRGRTSSGHTFNVIRHAIRAHGVRDADAALALVRELYNVKCEPPWPDDKLADKVSQAYTSAYSPPWGDAFARNNDTSGATNEKKKGAPSPVKLARRFLSEFATHVDGLTLRRWRGDWYRWTSAAGYYVAISDEQLSAELYRALELSGPAIVSNVKNSLIAIEGVLIDNAELGSWIGEPTIDADPRDLAVCKNGLLNLDTLELVPSTPRYFVTNALQVNFDVNAPTPINWVRFLYEIFGNDSETMQALQEWIGYLLTNDTRQQKIMMLLGPPRSGKGTILRIISKLLGPSGVAAPTLASVSSDFGLAPLIGKSAITINDARITNRSDLAQVVERLLSISGEDSLTIDRKFREAWTGRLVGRISVVSNELPRLPDASGAMATRMMILETVNSFHGKEDTNLTERLEGELQGIFFWAILGWKSLRARGEFLQPARSAPAVAELSNLSSAVLGWSRERCTIRPGAVVSVDDAFRDHLSWLASNGHAHHPTKEMFGRDVRAALGIQRSQQRVGDARVGVYEGIELKNDAVTGVTS